MDTLSYKTVSASKAGVEKNWIVVDAENQILGRIASEIARRLRGKHKANFTPNADCGDNVIVVNAEKIRLTGKKWDDKVYVSHTGYPGGQRFATPRIMLQKDSTKILENAVRGMLPKTRLGRDLFRNFFVYEGANHPHEAQQPKKIEL